MLDPAERRQLAHDLTTRFVAHHPGVLVGGVYGSTATQTDTPWSDLELCFVVADGSTAKGQHLSYRGIAVGYRVYEQRALEEILTIPSPRWPFHMGMLSALKVLYGDPTLIERWLVLGTTISAEQFREALVKLLPELVLESHGRIHSSVQRGEYANIQPAVWEVLDEILTALCLLNNRWVTHDYYKGLEDSFEFEKRPADYVNLVPALYHARQPEEIVNLADKLVAGFWHLLAEAGIHLKDYQTVEDIPV